MIEQSSNANKAYFNMEFDGIWNLLRGQMSNESYA